MVQVMSITTDTNLTLEEIARRSGVSRSTVSRVINQHPNVSQIVRERVQAVIEDTGYQPNLAAQTLVSKRTSMIGLVLPRSVSSFFTDPYFPRLLQGIAQGCNQHDYTLGLFLVDTIEDEEKILPRVSRKGMLDGLLIQSGQIGDHLIERVVNLDLPLVVIGSPLHSKEVSFIDVDNVNGAYNAVSHLIRLGYQRIATITGLFGGAAAEDRLEGYKKALNVENIKNELASQEKELKELDKKLARLENLNNRYHKEIEDWKKKIVENEEKIEMNVKEQVDMRTTIEKQKETVREVEVKLAKAEG